MREVWRSVREHAWEFGDFFFPIFTYFEDLTLSAFELYSIVLCRSDFSCFILLVKEIIGGR